MIALLIVCLLGLVSVQGDYVPSKCDESNFMNLITLSATWPQRQEAGVAYLDQPFSFVPKGQTNSVTWPAGTISIMGGRPEYNDVWISSDNAESWTLLSGTSFYVDGAYTSAKLADGTRTAMCQKENSPTMYVVAGTWSSAKTSRVQKGNLTHWTQITLAATFPVRERAICVVDKDENVYVFGGINAASTPVSTNDIWRAAGGANPWTRMTNTALWANREGQNVVIMPTSDRLMSATGEVMILAAGLRSSLRMNDIWASADRAVTWYRINAKAPWYGRQDADLIVSQAGVLVISAGDCGSECNVNDIWASLDGGFTWGQCCNHCGYHNREDHVTTFDRQGRLVLMSGAQTFPEYGHARDVWRSTISFNDVNAVSTACGVPIPACGVGIKCLPGGYCPCDPKGAGAPLQVVGIGPWRAARQEAGLAFRRTPLTFVDAVTRTTKTFSTSLIFYGGKLSSTFYNDVWASSDNGATWSMISGSYNGSTIGSNHLKDNSRSADCEDGNGRMYMIGGTNTTISSFVSSVWASDDGIDWFPATEAAPFWPREAAMCITDHLNNVYVFGGSHSVYTRLNDVWKSSNGGRDWTLQTMFAPWMARTQHDAASLYSTTLQKTILYVLNGIYNSPQASNRNNDIWMSSDDGVSWVQITSNAPYFARQDSETDSVGTVLVLTGGDIGTDVPGNVNDIWASVDGGYTWGLCNSSAGYTPREDQSTAFTSEGYLVLAGGDAPWTAQDAKVWRSEGSFSDMSYVTSRCGVSVPWCGAGINCWPSGTQRCDKSCPARAVSSSSSTGGAVAQSSTGGTAFPSSSSAPVVDTSAALGCTPVAVLPAGAITSSVDISRSLSALQPIGSSFGSQIVAAVQEAVRPTYSNVQSDSIRCANVASASDSASRVTLYFMRSSSASAPSPDAVLTALVANQQALSTQTSQRFAAPASNLVAPSFTTNNPTNTVYESESGKTSVGLAVGVCFLGLGVGLLIAFCVAWYCINNQAVNLKRPVMDEPSSNGHTMEMSKVDHETA